MERKVALITGSARGIGKEIALTFAKKGDIDIVVADINLDDSKATAIEIQKLGFSGLVAEPFKLNVADSASVTEVFKQIMDKFGRLDILVNNAGITRDTIILRMKDEDWESVLDINLKGAFLCSREAIKIMSKQRYGRIVNISSVVAFMGNAGQVNYSASKAGLLGLTKSLAREYAKRGITVNAVAPGFIKTAMTDSLPDKVKEEMMGAIPVGRFGEAQDVANAVSFLASVEAEYITGNVIHVNGGMYM
ncbi:MAG: 3-oxoacyl-[acyl-carrier-protein] reductase [Nitrospirae bacterium]|nr:3-oxoacyl-[acyl-carrier-protein] reductase [Nitrospirota bacterium]